MINDCFWDRINSSLNSYAEGMKLSEFAGQCKSRYADAWDQYVI